VAFLFKGEIMGKALTAEDLFANCAVQEVEFQIGEGFIKVKGLTKVAQQQARKNAVINGELDGDKLELAIFKAGVIEPKLSDEELERLSQSMPATTFDSIVLKISELSGLSKGFASQAKKS